MKGEAFTGRKVLITGGLGFIGSNLARRLVDLGANVLLVDSLIPDYGGEPFKIYRLQGRVPAHVAHIPPQSPMDNPARGPAPGLHLPRQSRPTPRPPGP